MSLAAVERAQDVAGAIVSALGIVPLAGESAEEAVERFLAAKHLLLVVDNCEHLPAAAPFIGRLPAAGPGVTVLATSREPLAVQAEHVYPVPPLALPEPGTQVDLGALARVDAVALFCERARAHDPEFELSDDNAGAVAAICRRLDGLPLAIELAAARCGLLSPGEIAARLDAALGALGSGPRDAPARQQTLRATLDWSHGLLDDDEQACFARFAVFAGGATVEAAETITGAGPRHARPARRQEPARAPPRASTGRPGWGCWKRCGRTPASASRRLPDGEAVRERHFALLPGAGSTPRDRFGARRPGRGASTSRAWTPRSRTSAPRCDWAAERDAAGRVLELSAALVDYWMRRDRYPRGRRLGAAGAAEVGRRRAIRRCAPARLCKVCWPLWALGHRDELLALLSEAEAIARTLTGSRDPRRGALQLRRGDVRQRPGRGRRAGGRRGAGLREGLRRCVDDRDGGLGASAGCGQRR